MIIWSFVPQNFARSRGSPFVQNKGIILQARELMSKTWYLVLAKYSNFGTGLVFLASDDFGVSLNTRHINDKNLDGDPTIRANKNLAQWCTDAWELRPPQVTNEHFQVVVDKTPD